MTTVIINRSRAAGGAAARPWAALAAVLLATFMGVLDAGIVTVAVPSVQRDLHASFGAVQFVAAGYALAYAVGLVTGGRLGDRYGRRRMFLTGVVLFVLASLACAAAPTAPALIAARVLQGLAAAVMLPQVLSIIQHAFTGQARATALACYGAAVGLASIAGQLAGGALLAWDALGLGWRAVFLVNVPIGAVALVAAGLTVRESRGAQARPDLAGAGLLALALTALLLPPVLERGLPVVAAGTGAGLALFAAFALVERRQADPLVPMRLLAQRRIVRGLLTVLAFYAGNAGFFLLLAYHLQAGLGLDPLGSGLVFAPLGAGFAVASLAGRRHGGPARGTVLMAIGLAGVLLVVLSAPAGDQIGRLLPLLTLCGVGQGLVAAPLIGTVLAGVDPADAGAAGGVLLTATQVANAAGVALIGALFARVLGSAPGSPGVPFTGYTHATAVTTVAVLVLAAVTGLCAGRR
ncbi:MFS transporter [Actinomadura macrotermitis]|uniref:Multidrug resistance protein Stp n=1 Tax=Actinomadura macrotermitis TaxID=2585200 RepID=A0A7K0C5W0_9ACTN|nr:MFS transporter [Actinomadura macrotermitis]MQY08837.1 Multidrug resistance protein Stp [Actinomadura macrotermitis]